MSDETTAETSDHDEATEAPARPRVPNVRPGAVSGLDNVLLNPDEDAAAEQADSDPAPEPDSEPVAPGTKLTSDEDGTLRTPDGAVYDGPVTESAPGTEPLVTTAIADPGTGDDTTDAGPDAADPDPDAPGA